MKDKSRLNHKFPTQPLIQKEREIKLKAKIERDQIF